MDFIQQTTANNLTYKCLDLDTPGIKVRAILPKPLIPFQKSKKLIKLILLHYPQWGIEDINYFQPPKEITNGGFLIFLNLSYRAQKTLAKTNWVIKLLGTNLGVCKHNAPKGTKPDLETDKSPDTTGLQNMEIV